VVERQGHIFCSPDYFYIFVNKEDQREFSNWRPRIIETDRGLSKYHKCILSQ
jgi:hypothetical protein